MQVGLVPVIPLGFAFFLPFVARLTKSRRFIEVYALSSFALTFLAGTWLFKATFSCDKPLVYAFGNWIAPIGIVFEVDKLSATLVLVTTFGFLLAGIYSTRIVRTHGIQFLFTSMLGLEAGTLGAFMTGDAFNLFVMLEVIGASAYGAVGFYRTKSEAVEGAFKYGISGAVATSLYFLALGFIYASFGTLNMADLSAKLHGISFPITTKLLGNPTFALAMFFAFTIGMVIVKSAIFPGHYWLPDAYSGAPIPVATVLSGFVEVVGLYILSRYFYTVFQGTHVVNSLPLPLLFLGIATAFLGSLMMLVQKDLKRLIAYSTILHMGYLLMTVAVLSPLALTAFTVHVVNHAISKALLFFTAGALITRAGTSRIDELSGFGKRMPLTTFLFAIATLSLIGVPPLNVFFSKMLIFDALLQKNIAFAMVVVVTSAIAAWAYFKALVELWRGSSHPGEASVKLREDPVLLGINLLLALLVILLGVLGPLLVSNVFTPATNQALNYTSYIDAVKHLSEAVLG